MPLRRLFSIEISGNARKKPYLTPSQRTVIIAKHEAGALLVELASKFRQLKSTIYNTIKRFSLY
jgi:DNA-binding MarR family transcriptional regulator